MTDLTKQDKVYTWNSQQQTAFDTLKQKITTDPVLIYPKFDRPFIVQCDASGYAIAGILSQISDKDNQEHPISFFSRTLLPAEKNYSTIEREGLAIVESIRVFRCYLWGRPFLLQTDHAPLRYIKQTQHKNQRLAPLGYGTFGIFIHYSLPPWPFEQ